MTTLTATDLAFIVRRIPKDVRFLMMDRGLYLAGGFIRSIVAGEEVHDIDLFGHSRVMLENCSKTLLEGRSGARSFETENAVTVLTPGRTPVQFIRRWLFDDSRAIVDSFDFTIARAVIWYDGRAEQWKSLCDEDFYPDLAAKRLVYRSPVRDEEAGGSLMRVRKFLARGYNIQAPSLAAVIARLMAKVKFNEMSSNEAGLSRIICGLLREVDPLTIVDGIPIDDHESFVPDSL